MRFNQRCEPVNTATPRQCCQKCTGIGMSILCCPQPHPHRPRHTTPANPQPANQPRAVRVPPAPTLGMGCDRQRDGQAGPTVFRVANAERTHRGAGDGCIARFVPDAATAAHQRTSFRRLSRIVAALNPWSSIPVNGANGSWHPSSVTMLRRSISLYSYALFNVY